MKHKTYYVYRHIRLDTNTPFYIGKGNGNRAYEKSNRNSHWKNIAAKTGFEVEIFLENLAEEKAFEKEKEFIKLYRDYGCKLANLTAGGEGLSNPTEEVRKKLGRPYKGFTLQYYNETTQIQKGI